MTWWPDTCGCIVDVLYSDTPPANPTVGPRTVKCSRHALLNDADVVYMAMVRSENGIKSQLMAEVLLRLPSLRDPSGLRPKDGYDLVFRYRDDHVCEVRMVGYSSIDKALIQGVANTRWPGKVVIV